MVLVYSLRTAIFLKNFEYFLINLYWRWSPKATTNNIAYTNQSKKYLSELFCNIKIGSNQSLWCINLKFPATNFFITVTFHEIIEIWSSSFRGVTHQKFGHSGMQTSQCRGAIYKGFLCTDLIYLVNISHPTCHEGAETG